MKKILFTLSFLSFFSFSNAQDTKKGPLLVCSNELNYGTINLGSDGLRILKLKNEGDEPLLINSVGSSCGCTVPSWPKEAVLPGAEAEIKVQYNTNINGRISKSISINSNSVDSKIKIVYLKGEVKSDK